MTTEADRQRSDHLRESLIFQRYLQFGYKPVAIGEDEIRRKFEFKGVCADMVLSITDDTAIVADSKGYAIGNVINQLRNTALNVRKAYRNVRGQVWLKARGLPTDCVQVGEGCTAKKQTDRNTPAGGLPSGSYILYDFDDRPISLDRVQDFIEVVFWQY